MSSAPRGVAFVPYDDLAGRPHIVVDGSATTGTVLTLSHWPGSPTPPTLAADLSAEIAFRYLDQPALHVDVEAVSNNHFDLDGLVGVLALVRPESALARRSLLEEVARVGDFAVSTDERAARIAAALGTFAEPSTSPLPAGSFTGPYALLAAALYGELLDRALDVVDRPDSHRSLWEEDEDRRRRTEAALASGAIGVEEVPALDLAVVTIAAGTGPLGQPRFTGGATAGWHPLPVHNATTGLRLLVVQDAGCELRLRYESWVSLRSRRPLPRVDLAPLAARLDEAEGAARWIADPVSQIAPSLHLRGGECSTIAPSVVRAEVESHLRSAPPAWDPYAPS